MTKQHWSAIGAVLTLLLAAGCGGGGGETSSSTTPGGIKVIAGSWSYDMHERCEEDDSDLGRTYLGMGYTGPGCSAGYLWAQDGTITTNPDPMEPMIGAGSTLTASDGGWTLRYRGGASRLMDVEGWTPDPSRLDGPEQRLVLAVVDVTLPEGQSLTFDKHGLDGFDPAVYFPDSHFLGPDHQKLTTGLHGLEACNFIFGGLSDDIEVESGDLPDRTLTLPLCFGGNYPPSEDYPEPLLWLHGDSEASDEDALPSAYVAIEGQTMDGDALADARESIEAVAKAAGADGLTDGFDKVFGWYLENEPKPKSGNFLTDAGKGAYWTDGSGVSGNDSSVGSSDVPHEGILDEEHSGPFEEGEATEGPSASDNLSDYDRGYAEGRDYGEEDGEDGDDSYADPEVWYPTESEEFFDGYRDGYAAGYAASAGSAPGGSDGDDDSGGAFDSGQVFR